MNEEKCGRKRLYFVVCCRITMEILCEFTLYGYQMPFTGVK